MPDLLRAWRSPYTVATVVTAGWRSRQVAHTQGDLGGAILADIATVKIGVRVPEPEAGLDNGHAFILRERLLLWIVGTLRVEAVVEGDILREQRLERERHSRLSEGINAVVLRERALGGSPTAQREDGEEEQQQRRIGWQESDSHSERKPQGSYHCLHERAGESSRGDGDAVPRVGTMSRMLTTRVRDVAGASRRRWEKRGRGDRR